MALPATGATRVIVHGALLAFVAGFVDVVGFIGLFGLFTAHVTGNFVMIGVELVGAAQGVLAKVLALPVFVLAVAATTLAVSALQRRQRSTVRPLLLTQAGLLAAFMLAGMAAWPIASAEAPLAITTGLLGVAAMGVQNAGSRLVLTDLVPTTIMTGNTTQVVIDAVNWLANPGTDAAAARTRLRKMLPAIATFAAGAILGALAFAQAAFWCLLAPMLLLLGLAAWPCAPSAPGGAA